MSSEFVMVQYFLNGRLGRDRSTEAGLLARTRVFDWSVKYMVMLTFMTADET